jgi:hypothetical protein
LIVARRASAGSPRVAMRIGPPRRCRPHGTADIADSGVARDRAARVAPRRNAADGVMG